MKNSVLKRIIAVVLCLVVFAGSELAGVTNIVGDLFASEGSEFESEADESEEEPADEIQEITLADEEEEEETQPEDPEEVDDNGGEDATEEDGNTEEPSGDDSVIEEGSSDSTEGESSEESSSEEVNEGGEESSGNEGTEAEIADGEENKDNEGIAGDEVITDGTEIAEEGENAGDGVVDDKEILGEETPVAEEIPVMDEIEGENPEEETEKEISYPAFADDYSDDKVKISVAAEEGVLPEGVVLAVTPIVKQDVEELESQEDVEQEEIDKIKEINEKYDVAAEKLEETVAEDETKNIAGFLAYDISFLVTEKDEETGEEKQVEIEPEGDVKVIMETNGSFLPDELAENENVSISSIDIVHMKEEGDELQPEVLTDAVIDIAENAEVKSAEFEVSQFSVFVIAWGDYNYVVQLNLVDPSGVHLENGGGGITLNLNDTTIFNVEDISKDQNLQGFSVIQEDGKEYSFVEARLVGESKELSPIAEIRKGDGAIEWRRKGDVTWENNGSPIVIFDLFYSDASIKEVPSIDSASKGVRLYMQDYPFDEELNGILGKGQTDATQGLVRPILNDDGFPVTAGSNVSLSKWYKDGKEVDGLFRKDKFEEEDTFYYSCFENYAYLGSGDQFTLYDQIGTPEETGSIGIYAQRGNFFPYNKIVEGNFSSATESYDENGNPLPADAEKRKLYKIQAEEGKAVLNFHFSMRLETDFIQGAGGKYNGESMIYSFNGDDDLWVFIDDVLVLDIGGNHPARSGYINFATGEVVVNQSEGAVKTTIKDCFDKAIEYCRENGIEKTISSKWVEYEPGKYRFEDNSGHTLKMFYMERNHAEKDGGSNLKVSFNLPTIEADKIRVTKELTGTAQTQYANVDFNFRVWIKNNGSYEKLTADAVDDDGNPIVVDKKTGIFKLKPGQSAWFSNLLIDQEYYVEEIGYGQVGSDYIVEETSYQEYETENQAGDTVIGTKTDDKSVKERKRVTFTNKCSEEIKNELLITKVMSGSSEGQEQESFNIKVWLENRDGVLVPYSGDYYIGDVLGNTSDGTISLKVGETATIRELVAGTAFYVEESPLDPDVYETPVIEPVADDIYGYESDQCESSFDNGGKKAQYAITKGKDAKVVVTNTLKVKDTADGSLQITKKIETETPELQKDISFEFEVSLKGQTEKFESYKGSYTLNADGKTEQKETSDGHISIPVNGTVIIESIKSGVEFQVKEILAEDSLYELTGIVIKNADAGSNQNDIAQGKIIAGKRTEIEVTNKQKPESSYSYDWQIVKKGTDQSSKPLQDAEFTLTAGTTVYYGKSQPESGVVKWFTDAAYTQEVSVSDITPDEYVLAETKAPTGYVCSGEEWKIELGYGSIKVNGDVKPTDSSKTQDGKTIYEYTFFNETIAYELPSTGGTGIFWYMISGVLLMMAGVLVLYKRKYAGRC